MENKNAEADAGPSHDSEDQRSSAVETRQSTSRTDDEAAGSKKHIDPSKYKLTQSKEAILGEFKQAAMSKSQDQSSSESTVTDLKQGDHKSKTTTGSSRDEPPVRKPFPRAPTPVADSFRKKGAKSNHTCMEYICIYMSLILVILTLPVSLLFTVKIVHQFERVVILRMGRVRKGKARGPGVFFVLPCTDQTIIVDLRTTSFEIIPQEVLTKDSCTIYVDAVVFYRVAEPFRAVININNYRDATGLVSATTLRNLLGQLTLTEILSHRDALSGKIGADLEMVTSEWGIKIEVVEIKDISLPQRMQRAMAAEAEAVRDARAKVISAEGELQASTALKEASDIIMQSPYAIQLRYLQTLANIATEEESVVLFPVPVNVSELK